MAATFFERQVHTFWVSRQRLMGQIAKPSGAIALEAMRTLSRRCPHEALRLLATRTLTSLGVSTMEPVGRWGDSEGA